MAAPTCKAELQTILGMANYLTKFTPNLSDITAPMRDLLKKDFEFLWDSQQEIAFNKMKEVITKAPVLAFYDSKKELTLEVDSSERATGATLMQEGRPTEYASRALAENQQGWAPIEREMLAIIHGCERFRQYIIGRTTTVQTDHKPLISIISKPLSKAPKRLQGMMLELQRYRYDINVIFKPGKDIPVTDCLTRNLATNLKPDKQDNLSTRIDVAIHSLVTSLPISDPKLNEVRTCTANDESMQVLKHFVTTGWPNQRKDCPTIIPNHWNQRDELAYSNGLIFKGDRIVIPPALREDMLNQIHKGHFGIEKCRSRARQALFWPGMNADIQHVVPTAILACHSRMLMPRSH